MLPSLSSLRAFEAVARHLSVSRAAEELRVTQPAVSQQVRQLETFLDVPLVRRAGRRLALTSEGQAYAAALGRAFAEIRMATSRCLAARTAGVLTVALLPTFAMRWLIPRLSSFHAAHPEIEVRLATSPRLSDLVREDVDVAIRVGDGQWPRHRVDFLMADDVFPVASPDLLRHRPLERPQDLALHTLLHVEAAPRTGDWSRWLAAAGRPGLQGAGRLGFESSAQALEAARGGVGVAMAHRPFVDDDLAVGRLVAPFRKTVPGGGAYYAVSRTDVADLPRVQVFRTWLLAQAGVGRPLNRR